MNLKKSVFKTNGPSWMNFKKKLPDVIELENLNLKKNFIFTEKSFILHFHLNVAVPKFNKPKKNCKNLDIWKIKNYEIHEFLWKNVVSKKAQTEKSPAANLIS